MQEQAIAAHCQPSGCSQELTGAPSVLQEGPKASPPSSLLPASASPSQEEHGSQKTGTGLMDHRSSPQKGAEEEQNSGSH